MNPHKITADFEDAICAYTGSPYCVTVDNASNGLYMALIYEGIEDKEITIPSHTYPSVPCEIIRAGGHVKFEDSPEILQGEYQLKPTRVWDSALRFTADMYREGQLQVVSFTGQWKILKTIKGGAILTDSHEAYMWLKRFRYSGRREVSYLDDNFDMLGINAYMPHVFAAIGLMNIQGLYNMDGSKREMPDIAVRYPDLSKFDVYVSDKG